MLFQQGLFVLVVQGCNLGAATGIFSSPLWVPPNPCPAPQPHAFAVRWFSGSAQALNTFVKEREEIPLNTFLSFFITGNIFLYQYFLAGPVCPALRRTQHTAARTRSTQHSLPFPAGSPGRPQPALLPLAPRTRWQRLYDDSAMPAAVAGSAALRCRSVPAGRLGRAVGRRGPVCRWAFPTHCRLAGNVLR